MDRVPEELWMEVHNIVQEAVIKSMSKKKKSAVQFTQSCPILCNPMDCSTPGFPDHHQLPEQAQTYLSSWWCHPIILSSVIPFSSCLQTFPASGSFPMSQLFRTGDQSIGGLISLRSKGLSRFSSNTTVQKHQFFSTQLSLYSNSHIHTWLLKKS